MFPKLNHWELIRSIRHRRRGQDWRSSHLTELLEPVSTHLNRCLSSTDHASRSTHYRHVMIPRFDSFDSLWFPLDAVEAGLARQAASCLDELLERHREVNRLRNLDQLGNSSAWGRDMQRHKGCFVWVALFVTMTDCRIAPPCLWVTIRNNKVQKSSEICGSQDWIHTLMPHSYWDTMRRNEIVRHVLYYYYIRPQILHTHVHCIHTCIHPHIHHTSIPTHTSIYIPTHP